MLLAEPSHNTRREREKTVELLFERFKSPAAFLAKSAVLASFAVGRQTSLVIDSAHNSTTGELHVGVRVADCNDQLQFTMVPAYCGLREKLACSVRK